MKYPVSLLIAATLALTGTVPFLRTGPDLPPDYPNKPKQPDTEAFRSAEAKRLRKMQKRAGK